MYRAQPEIGVEGIQRLARRPRRDTGAQPAAIVGRVRDGLATTPGRLTLIAVLIVAGAVAFGSIATAAERSRAQAVQAVRAQTEPLLIQAVNLYSALSDANATATTTFLTGGLEPPARRARYLRDLHLASHALATLTLQIGSAPDARAAVTTVTNQLPVYSGLVEAARANNRQGLPVGAAYMRQASTLLTRTILPAANRLFGYEARRLGRDYRSGTGTVALIVLVASAAISLGLLILGQLYLARVSRRILNVPVLLATIVVAGVSVWASVALISEQNALALAQRDGSDPAEVLSATTVLLSRAQSDESLTLVNRGSDVTDPADFSRVMDALAPPRGLLDEVAVRDKRAGISGAATQLDRDFASYQAEATRIGSLEGGGRLASATRVAISPSAIAVANRLSNNLAGQTGAVQERFTHAASDATSSLSGLSIAIPALTVLAAVLALIGLRQRLEDYR